LNDLSSVEKNNIQTSNWIEYPKELYHWSSKKIDWPFKWWTFTWNPRYADIYKSSSASSVSKWQRFYKMEDNPWLYKVEFDPSKNFDIRNKKDLSIYKKYLETDGISWPWYWISQRWVVDWTEWENLKYYLDEKYPWKYNWVTLDEWARPNYDWKPIDRWISYTPVRPESIKPILIKNGIVKTKSQLRKIREEANRK
jgi:hypothetical protein